MKITAAHLRRLASGAKPEVVEAIVESAPEVLPRYGITSPLRMQHFFAQLAHESGGLRVYEENLNYSAKRLTQVWPRRFPSLAVAKPYANNPRKLANKVYGDRMGNRPGTDDGYDFRGRGLIQITGRDGYRKVGLEDDPGQAGQPENFLEVAGAFWKWKDLNGLADRDDLEAVTRRVNGGLNGLADREEYLDKAKRIFTSKLDASEPQEDADEEPSKPDMSDPPQDVSSVSRPLALVSPDVNGDAEIYDVQRRLKAMNYPTGVQDGTWGGMTAGAITAFINDRQLDIIPATSVEAFRKISDRLRDEITKAESDRFKRPVSAERAHATAKDIENKLPTVKQTWWSRFWAKVQAIVASITAVFWATIEWLQSNEYTGPIIEFVNKVPRYAWVALGLGAAVMISGLIWRSQRHAEQAVIDQYREGRIQT